MLDRFERFSFAIAEISRCWRKLASDEQKEVFEKFHDCWSEYMSLAEAAIFEYAFKLGARLAIEVQKDT